MPLHLWILKLQTESAFSGSPLSHFVGNSGEIYNSKVCLYLEISWLTHNILGYVIPVVYAKLIRRKGAVYNTTKYI